MKGHGLKGHVSIVACHYGYIFCVVNTPVSMERRRMLSNGVTFTRTDFVQCFNALNKVVKCFMLGRSLPLPTLPFPWNFVIKDLIMRRVNDT